jgi:hypothetical protein
VAYQQHDPKQQLWPIENLRQLLRPDSSHLANEDRQHCGIHTEASTLSTRIDRRDFVLCGVSRAHLLKAPHGPAASAVFLALKSLARLFMHLKSSSVCCVKTSCFGTQN